MAPRKDALRDAALAYLLEHGVANASLRPMAAAIGTSARLLIFHFKSKERLLEAVFGELHARLQASFTAMLAADPGPVRRVAPLKRFFLWATTPETLPYVRLLYEVQIIAIQNPDAYARFLKQTSRDWLALSERALSASIRSKAMATLCIAVFDGLVLEVLATGDRARATRALDHFVAMAVASAPAARQRPGTRPSTR